MLDFEDVWKLTQTVSNDAAYSPAECRELFDRVIELEEASHIVEVGCEFGRSTSILAQVAKEHRHELTLVDPFVTNLHAEPEPFMACMQMLRQVGCRFTLHCMKTEELRRPWTIIDFLHIDGDHMEPSLEQDCRYFLPMILPAGGIVCFHDYGRPSLESVQAVVDRHTETGWEDKRLVETLFTARKE